VSSKWDGGRGKSFWPFSPQDAMETAELTCLRLLEMGLSPFRRKQWSANGHASHIAPPTLAVHPEK